MGLAMDDLHAPTVTSGPRASEPRNGVSPPDMPLLELIAEKERVEKELLALGSVLESHGVNMNTSLTTFDGFPRADIDVAQIRTTRAKIIRLRNDYKGLMARIEAGLHAHHAAMAANPPAHPTAGAVTGGLGQANGASGSSTSSIPFAKVNTVAAGSPAEDAGLRAGDLISKFGSIHWSNHDRLKNVAEEVAKNEDRLISVHVSRKSPMDGTLEELQVQLRPRRDWGGRGLLGCHLLPV